MYHLSPWQRFWRLEVPHAHAGARLEHDDVGVGRLVLRRRLRGDHRLRPDDHAARHRLLYRDRDRRSATLRRSAMRCWSCWSSSCSTTSCCSGRCSRGRASSRATRSADEDNVRPWFLIVLQRARLFDLVAVGGAGAQPRHRRRADRARPAPAAQRAARPRGRRPGSSAVFDIALLGSARRARSIWIVALHPRRPSTLAEIGWVVRARADHRGAGAGADRASPR